MRRGNEGSRTIGAIARLLAGVRGAAVALTARVRSPRARKGSAGSRWPISVDVVRGGEVSLVPLTSDEEWIELRSELEGLRLLAEAGGEEALGRLSRLNSTDAATAVAKLSGLLLDARSPVTAATLAAMDEHAPDLLEALPRNAINREVSKLHEELQTCLESDAMQRIDDEETLSDGEIERTDETTDAVIESENAMPDQDKTNVNDQVQPDAESVEEALSSVESGLDDLSKLVASEGETDVVTAEAAADDSAQETTDSLDATDSIESAIDAALNGPDAIDEEPQKPQEAESTANIQSDATHLSDSIQEVEAAFDDPTINASDAAIEESAEGIADEAADTLSQDTADHASDEVTEAATADAVAPATADPPTDVLPTDNAALNDADAALNDEAPQIPETETPTTPADPNPVGESESEVPDCQVQPQTDEDVAPQAESQTEPVAQAQPRRRRARRIAGRRTPADDVEAAINNMAAFLQDEVAELWDHVREAMEDVLADRDTVADARERAEGIHKEMKAMRDEVARARRESRQLQSQLQNLRDETTRARQRADAAACDAQNASDRAIAAAREAESALEMKDEG